MMSLRRYCVLKYTDLRPESFLNVTIYKYFISLLYLLLYIILKLKIHIYILAVVNKYITTLCQYGLKKNVNFLKIKLYLGSFLGTRYITGLHVYY